MMKELLKKGALIYVISVVVIFGLSFITAGNNDPMGRLGASALMAIASTVLGLYVLYGDNKKKSGKSTSKITSNRNTSNNSKKVESIFVCQPLSNKIFYEIKGNKVYKYQTSKVAYEIKNGKIYRYLEPTPILIINGNKLHAPSKSTPLYRIENNKVYEGDFARKPIYDLRDSKHIHNQSGQQ